jgi:hypothetical protein
MVTVKSYEHDVTLESQIGIKTPFAMVSPVEKLRVLARGSGVGYGWMVRWPGPLGFTATTLMCTALLGPRGRGSQMLRPAR